LCRQTSAGGDFSFSAPGDASTLPSSAGRHRRGGGDVHRGFLCIFATVRVDTLLLDEGSMTQEALADVEGCRPVLNGAPRYQ
jgi:hypothetical protein